MFLCGGMDPQISQIWKVNIAPTTIQDSDLCISHLYGLFFFILLTHCLKIYFII